MSSYITVVSCIYATCFATLALVESMGGAYTRNLTFYLANPLPGPCLDVDIGTLQTVTEAGLTPICLCFSCPPYGQDRLTEVGHSVDSGIFQALRGQLRNSPMIASVSASGVKLCYGTLKGQMVCGCWFRSGTAIPLWRP